MEDNYQLMTDSSSDLPKEYLEKENIVSMPLSVTIGEEHWYDDEIDRPAFYDKMRAGAMPVTSQVNVAEALSMFESVLQKGRDILYIAFSSGMSGTINSARMAAQELASKYPERKIVIVDSLSVTLGQGMLVHLTNEMKKTGASLEKAAQWVRDHVMNVAHFVTCSDMEHLHRGGRISKTSTIIGSLLGIQPIITLNEDGEAKMTTSKRGKKHALNFLVDSMAKIIGSTVNNICFISHTDCENDALYVKQQVQSKLGIRKFLITQAGPILGTHTGPGAIALCMMVDHR